MAECYDFEEMNTSDRYAKIRKALEMKPTPGPWKTDGTFIENKTHIVAISHNPENYKRDAALIAACDPDTIRELLAERDALAAENERLRKALEEIANLSERPYDKFPSDWRDQIAACPECQRYKDHPIQRGICDGHRKPLYDREDHYKYEESVLGYRAKSIAREALAARRALKGGENG